MVLTTNRGLKVKMVLRLGFELVRFRLALALRA